MLSKIFTAGTAIVAAVSALPPATSKWNAIPQLARFDNENGIPLVAAKPIGIYLDIYWQGMSLVATMSLQDDIGVTPNSKPNYAAFSALDVATVLQGQASMMTNYDDSTVDHLDLNYFYYGCAVASEASVLGLPTSCEITITGYADDAGKQKVAEEKFGYTTKFLQTRAQMLQATPSKKFRGVKRVDFDVSKNLTTAGLVDGVSYTVYSDKNISP